MTAAPLRALHAAATAAAALAVGCGNPPASPSVDDRDSFAIAEVAYAPLALPAIPGHAAHLLELPKVVEADQAAATTGLVLRGAKLGHDPQVAVGDRFLFVYTAHNYQLLDKATGAVAAARTGDEIPANGDFGSLFSPLWSPVDARGRPNVNNLNLKMHYAASDPLKCDLQKPHESIACVQEFYDSRIQYDAQRRRFWIESAVRNHIWQCGGKRPCNKENLSETQARRFIAVAVSRTEDPRDGFHRYALVDEYQDWPKIAVHDRYLLLSHRASSTLYVFDADKLARGNPGGGPVRLAKIDMQDFGARFFDPVMHRGPSPGVTFLFATDGSATVSVLGLVDDAGDHAAPPTVVRGPRVDIGSRVGHIENDAIWRDGALHATWDECTPGRSPCVRRARVLRLPTTYTRAHAEIESFVNGGGYRNAVLVGAEPGDAPADDVSAEKPALDVNGAGDVVVVYARRSGEHATHAVMPEARYAILGRADARPRPSVLVRRGTFADVPDIDDNAKAGIDLAFAQTDPSDDRSVWITHAVAEADVRWFRQIVAVIHP